MWAKEEIHRTFCRNNQPYLKSKRESPTQIGKERKKDREKQGERKGGRERKRGTKRKKRERGEKKFKMY